MDGVRVAIIAVLVGIVILLTTMCLELDNLGKRLNVLERIEWTEE